jgi:hypothetical protein
VFDKAAEDPTVKRADLTFEVYLDLRQIVPSPTAMPSPAYPNASMPECSKICSPP